jgi:hypothetical protein
LNGKTGRALWWEVKVRGEWDRMGEGRREEEPRKRGNGVEGERGKPGREKNERTLRRTKEKI